MNNLFLLVEEIPKYLKGRLPSWEEVMLEIGGLSEGLILPEYILYYRGLAVKPMDIANLSTTCIRSLTEKESPLENRRRSSA